MTSAMFKQSTVNQRSNNWFVKNWSEDSVESEGEKNYA